MSQRASQIQDLWNTHHHLLEKHALKPSFQTLVDDMKAVREDCHRWFPERRTIRGWTNLFRASRIATKLRQLNERVFAAYQDWQTHVLVTTFALTNNIRDDQLVWQEKMSELLERLSKVSALQQHYSTTIYSHSGKNEMFMRITESYATLNVLSTDTRDPQLRKIELSLEKYRELTSENPATLQFTTEDGEFWSFDRTIHTVDGLLRECEALIQCVLSGKSYSPVHVIQKLRRLAIVLHLLELQEESIIAGECAIELARGQAKQYHDLRTELADTLFTIANLRTSSWGVARALYQESINLRASVCLEEPTLAPEQILEARNALGDLLYEAADIALLNHQYYDCRVWFEEATSTRHRIFEDKPCYVDGLKLLEATSRLATSISCLNSQDPSAPRTFMKAIQLGRRLVQDYPDEDKYGFISVLYNLGDLYNWSGRSALATPWLEEALPLQRAVATISDKPDARNFLALILEALAAAYTRTGQSARAIHLIDECIAIRRDLRLVKPDMQRWHMARVLGVVAEVQKGLNQEDKAFEAVVEATILARQEYEISPYIPQKALLMRLTDDLTSLLISRNAPLDEWTLVFESMLLWEES